MTRATLQSVGFLELFTVVVTAIHERDRRQYTVHNDLLQGWPHNNCQLAYNKLNNEKK